jgi:hypothetical protein
MKIQIYGLKKLSPQSSIGYFGVSIYYQKSPNLYQGQSGSRTGVNTAEHVYSECINCLFFREKVNKNITKIIGSFHGAG